MNPGRVNLSTDLVLGEDLSTTVSIKYIYLFIFIFFENCIDILSFVDDSNC